MGFLVFLAIDTPPLVVSRLFDGRSGLNPVSVVFASSCSSLLANPVNPTTTSSNMLQASSFVHNHPNIPDEGLESLRRVWESDISTSERDSDVSRRGMGSIQIQIERLNER